MVFPIMPQQRNNYQPRLNQFPNNRLPSHINKSANANSIQQIFKNISNPDSSIGSMATKGLGNISKTLSNVDQVIKVVRSATPIVQEYGPMVKNLPAMYRMVKAFSQIEDDHDDQTDQKIEVEVSTDDSIKKETVSTQKDQFPRKSTPRLYI